MCKLCELENQEMIMDNDHAFLYIMNNLGISPQLVFGERPSNGTNNHLPINYCPFCGN